jgi:hypothetical protein
MFFSKKLNFNIENLKKCYFILISHSTLYNFNFCFSGWLFCTIDCFQVRVIFFCPSRRQKCSRVPQNNLSCVDYTTRNYKLWVSTNKSIFYFDINIEIKIPDAFKEYHTKNLTQLKFRTWANVCCNRYWKIFGNDKVINVLKLCFFSKFKMKLDIIFYKYFTFLPKNFPDRKVQHSKILLDKV